MSATRLTLGPMTVASPLDGSSAVEPEPEADPNADAERQRLRVARIREVGVEHLPLADALALLRGPGMDPDPAVRRAVLMRRDLPIEELALAMSDPDPATRAFAIGAQGMPVELIIAAATDDDWQVRYEVAGHPSCPAEVLARLAADPSPMVRRQALIHDRTPIEVLLAVLLDGTSALDARVAAAHPGVDIVLHESTLLAANEFGARGVLDRADAPGSLIDHYLHCDRSALLRTKAASHRACPSNALDRAARDPARAVRAAAAAHPQCPAAALTVLADDDERLVRLACAGNPSAPSAAIHRLLRDSDEHLRTLAAAHQQAAPEDLLVVVRTDTFAAPKQAALQNPNCGREALEIACVDPDLVLVAARNPSCSHDALFDALITLSAMPRAVDPRTSPTESMVERCREVAEVAKVARRRLARMAWAWLAERDLLAVHPEDLVVLIGSRGAEAAHDQRKEIRIVVAAMPQTTAETLMHLARDPSEQVRRIVTDRILTAAGGDRTLS